MDEDDLLDQLNFVAPHPPPPPDYSDLENVDGTKYQSMYDFLEPYITMFGQDYVNKWKLRI